MTANLVVQVCMEPKLVGVALERDSVTARLVSAGGAFTVSLLSRSERDVVRRFVKPVTDVERSPEGAVVAMAGQPVTEIGPHRVPVLGSAAGYLAVHADQGRVARQPHPVHRRGHRGRGRAGRGPPDGGHADALRRLVVAPPRLGVLASRSVRCARCSPVAAGLRRPQVDAQRQDAVDQLSFGVADHGEVGVVTLGLLAEALSLGTLDGRHAALFDGAWPAAENAPPSRGGRRPSRRPA